jgi:hypothetical protein
MQTLEVIGDVELAQQRVTLLPARRTMLTINVLNIIAINLAIAVNAATLGAAAIAMAGQQVMASHY